MPFVSSLLSSSLATMYCVTVTSYSLSLSLSLSALFSSPSPSSCISYRRRKWDRNFLCTAEYTRSEHLTHVHTYVHMEHMEECECESECSAHAAASKREGEREGKKERGWISLVVVSRFSQSVASSSFATFITYTLTLLVFLHKTHTLFLSLASLLNMRLKLFSFHLTSKLTTDGMKRSHLFTFSSSSLLVLLATSWYTNSHRHSSSFSAYRKLSIYISLSYSVNCKFSSLSITLCEKSGGTLCNNSLFLHHTLSASEAQKCLTLQSTVREEEEKKCLQVYART